MTDIQSLQATLKAELTKGISASVLSILLSLPEAFRYAREHT